MMHISLEEMYKCPTFTFSLIPSPKSLLLLLCEKDMMDGMVLKMMYGEKESRGTR